MRPIFTFSAAILIALPLAAAEDKPAAQPAPASQPAAVQPAPSTGTVATAASATPDSPLVAAAKHTNRKGKKSKIVITNETLGEAGSKARVTTTASQHEVQLPPREPATDWTTMEQKKLADATKAKAAADDARKKRTAAMAAAYEEGYSEADPAQVERELSTQNPQQPQRAPQTQPAPPPQKP